ncbi:methyltransferase domain-containing protein [Bradyrhizobium sp. S3.2.6]|uniref:methyltransferase domain-containing protein n=1 Tax=Bradyrhizobium sp. S3.2.6 TaxID=3156428 RepID=UPI00339107E8
MYDFVCPQDHQPLTLAEKGAALVSAAGARYPVRDGIPDFVAAAGHEDPPEGNQQFYRTRAQEYDLGNSVMFRMLQSEEEPVREDLADTLKLASGARVLEIGCGTCRDTVHLLRRNATVYAGDLSQEMLAIGKQRLSEANADLNRVRLFRADAMSLPFPDGFFDAAFHFGGLNLFPDIAASLAEMARVVKIGGRVVAGDEGVGSWLAQTEFAKILKNSNPLFTYAAPLDKVPVNARDVTCRWVLQGSFYLISFEVGQGEPQLDLDVEFPGWRGGSHRTRYFGRLEGVSPQLRDSVVKQAATEGLSISAWLEKTLHKATGTK